MCCEHCIGHRNDPNKYNQHLAPCSEGCNGDIADGEERDGTA